MKGLKRFTIIGDTYCERCLGDILDGEYAGRVTGLVDPWVVGTVICSACADLLEDRWERRRARA